ncbi:MAG: DUF3857 domain-containing protein [Dysgonamonadaceae bacterium]|jgi:hypothetical protein|nr:DUF3857 domain-containing protein [Dysgonamonadaceae bacterium]
MKTTSYLLTCVFAICFSVNVHADDYTEYALEIKKTVWAWDKPEFNNYTLPDDYKKESAVILARHEEIKALSKKKFRVSSGFMALNTSLNRELYYTGIERQMVRINDKVALEKYSDISFKEERQTRGIMRSNKFRLVVGVRIIKPDGSITEVNVDDEAVAITEGKKDKEAYRKLAIPGLQVGDIIDYFFCHRLELETQNIGIQYFTFCDEYPMLSYSVHCEISRKLTVEYAAMNGAPDFIQSTNDEKDIVLDVARKNLPKMGDARRWTSFMRDLPSIRVSILNNASKMIFKPKTARKEGLYKRGDKLQRDHFIDDILYYVDIVGKNPYFRWNVWNDVKKATKNYQKQHPDATQEQLADYIYDAIHFYSIDNEYFRPLNFSIVYARLLEEFKIPCEKLLAVNKYGARMSDVITDDDFTYVTKINDRRYYFFPGYLYHTPNRINPGCQGEDAYIYAAKTLENKKKIKNKKVTEHDTTIPQTRAEDNKSVSVIKVSFSPDDPSTLLIDRKMEYSGQLKSDMQSLLGSYEAWDKEMRKRLLIEKTWEEDMRSNKRDRKYVDEMKAIFDKRRNDLKDSVKAEIRRFHDLATKEISGYELSALGVTPDNPNMKFSVNYALDGLVKKAGKNLLLDAGKLIGSQWMPDTDDRARTLNAYLPTPRMYVCEIEIQIPESYKVQGLEKLNKSIENEYASFRASASREGSVLKIRTEKSYLRSFVPVAAWKQLLEVMDKANEFYVQSVVLY